jgi:hypothetical protein
MRTEGLEPTHLAILEPKSNIKAYTERGFQPFFLSLAPTLHPKWAYPVGPSYTKGI